MSKKIKKLSYKIGDKLIWDNSVWTITATGKWGDYPATQIYMMTNGIGVTIWVGREELDADFRMPGVWGALGDL